MAETADSRPAVQSITDKEIQDGKLMSILAYIGILVFIPLLTSRENKYVMYHTEQGLALFISWIVIWILFRFVDPILSNLIDIYFCGGSLIYSLVRLFLLVLLILGIINAAQGKIKELPGIGTFGKSFNFVK